MGMGGFAWVWVDSHGSGWIRMGLGGFAWVLVDSHGSGWIRMGMDGFIWVWVDSHGYGVNPHLRFVHLDPTAALRFLTERDEWIRCAEPACTTIKPLIRRFSTEEFKPPLKTSWATLQAADNRRTAEAGTTQRTDWL
eukprot:5777987-Pyramimonas_sp.AAC.2